MFSLEKNHAKAAFKIDAFNAFYIIYTYESSSNSSRSDIEMTSQISNCYNFRQI